MRRQRIELAEIAEWNNLQLAVWKAAKGKRDRPDVLSYLADSDFHIRQLQQDILTERVPYGLYRSFLIHDPKLRRIHAACFADRVLHHAILNRAEPVFERTLVDSTYACRPGKGVHLAVRQVQNNLRRFPWFVQVDVAGYFPSIDHEWLFNLLARRFKGKPFLSLLKRIIDSYATSPGKGLPIGSLTSQHFANLYLDSADRFLLTHPEVCAHVRYMDDILWWCREKAQARSVLRQFKAFMETICRLQLKPNVRINRSAQGMTYCGFRILPGMLRLTLRKRRRYRLLRQHYESAWDSGMISSRKLQAGYDAVLAATLPAQSMSWRQRDLQLHPCLYDNDRG